MYNLELGNHSSQWQTFWGTKLGWMTKKRWQTSFIRLEWQREIRGVMCPDPCVVTHQFRRSAPVNFLIIEGDNAMTRGGRTPGEQPLPSQYPDIWLELSSQILRIIVTNPRPGVKTLIDKQNSENCPVGGPGPVVLFLFVLRINFLIIVSRL